MKKHLLLYGLLPLVFLMGFSLNSKAQLLFEENFAYPVGDLLTAHGWVAHSGAGTNAIAATAASISYTGYLSSGIGDEVSLLASGEDDHKSFAPQTTGTVYASFLVNVTLATATGDYFFHLGTSTFDTYYKARVFVKNDGTGNLAFGITHTGGASNPAIYTPFSYALNTTYMVVVKYTFVDGTANDIASLIINPVIGATEPAATVTAADVAQSDPAEVGSVALRQGAAANGPNAKVDGIRVGSTWNDVAGAATSVSLVVASPVVGDQWRQGTTHNIAWSASGTNSNVIIEFTDNASAATQNWYTLNASFPASTGTWAWNIPANQALSADCKIRITDIPQTAAGLSGTFSIVTPPAQITTLAALRTVAAGTVYTYTGQGIVTFKQTFRNQKYIQDATAAILIDDNSARITSPYEIGDAMTNVTGTVAVFNGMTQFTPESDPGLPSSTGNTITPEVVTLAQLNANWENYEAELIKVPNVTFTAPTGNFANGVIYPVTDNNSTAANFRTTFYDVDYINTAIPTAIHDLVVIPNSRIDGDQITCRSLSDFIALGSTVADFDATPTTLFEGGHVQFHDLSTNNPTGWAWTFPGGTPASSVGQNPLIQYNTYGIFAVTLTATNVAGSNTLTKNNYINVGVDGITTLPSVVTVYPNPTNGRLFITNPAKATQEIAIFSAAGKQVASAISAEGIISLDISGQASGLYMVRITNKADQDVKIVKISLN
ncbi:MAG: T9SS type A sorting domain-containing protein [Bacteroidota bacterium]